MQRFYDVQSICQLRRDEIVLPLHCERYSALLWEYSHSGPAAKYLRRLTRW
jgi:hypothetical protein